MTSPRSGDATKTTVDIFIETAEERGREFPLEAITTDNTASSEAFKKRLDEYLLDVGTNIPDQKVGNHH